LKPCVLHLFVLVLFVLLPLINHLLRNRFPCAVVLRIPRDLPLKFAERVPDLQALLLLLVQLLLQLARHPVVLLLSVPKLVADLMDVCQGVQVLVLVHRHITAAIE
jgi:hypothetical protein